ncbi:MAG: tetratricopeptide repeat protein [Thermodesulfobacteriota bacterium]
MKAILTTILVLGLLMPISSPVHSDEGEERKVEAKRFLEIGLALHQMGDYRKAVESFKKSIELDPTAPGYTYMAWSFSYLGKLDLAISLAEKAIELAPNFGNPYNDIGAYLMEKGLYDEAIPYLRKAMKAPDYCCYFYPYFNLGKIYAIRGHYVDAITELEQALKIKPDFVPAIMAIELIKRRMEESL